MSDVRVGLLEPMPGPARDPELADGVARDDYRTQFAEAK